MKKMGDMLLRREAFSDQKHTCVEIFGCPTFTRNAVGKVTVNTDLCIADGQAR